MNDDDGDDDDNVDVDVNVNDDDDDDECTLSTDIVPNPYLASQIFQISLQTHHHRVHHPFH